MMKEKIIEFKTRDEPIWIYSNKIRESKVVEFSEDLFSAINNYFIKKYGYVDSDLNKENQFENYRWLLQNDFISEDRYLELKSKLKEDIKKTGNKSS